MPNISSCAAPESLLPASTTTIKANYSAQASVLSVIVKIR